MFTFYTTMSVLAVRTRMMVLVGTCLVGLVACVGGRERNPVLLAHTEAKTLPIDLTNFQVEPIASAVQVRWETDTELGCAFFEIERSADDKQYERIGRVTGDAMAVTKRRHSFVDTTPLQGAAYYRLRQVDLDGVVHVSEQQLINSGVPAQPLVAAR